MHIGAQPNTKVDADSKLAVMTLEHLNKKAEDDLDGLIHIPESFIGLKGVENTAYGASYSLKWFKQE